MRKYMKRAPLSTVYKIIRKDLKVNGKRAKNETVLADGDEISLYISDEQMSEFTKPVKRKAARRNFKIAYEDEKVLIVEKPWGLLTHGDSHEKKNTLMNQVCGYLQEKGEYDPSVEKTFTPSPVNRLDRNTTGLVIFGKTAESLRKLTRLIRERKSISKYYLTIVCGDFREEMHIEESLSKDSETNTVSADKEGKYSNTVVRPVFSSGRYSLVEVELLTGRTHQIRAHLSSAGYPLAGDAKYGDYKVNRRLKEYGLSTQLLHAYRLTFEDMPEGLEALNGMDIRIPVPEAFGRIGKKLLGKGIGDSV